MNRARINASDEATGQVADLECVDSDGRVILAVEVKDRLLSLSDFDGTLQKSRQREIRDVFFTSAGIRGEDKIAVDARVAQAFAADQNLYVFDFFELARGVLALGGETIRLTFLRRIGEHLDTSRHRQDWKKLLETV